MGLLSYLISRFIRLGIYKIKKVSQKDILEFLDMEL